MHPARRAARTADADAHPRAHAPAVHPAADPDRAHPDEAAVPRTHDADPGRGGPAVAAGFNTAGGSILYGTTATVGVRATDAYSGKALSGREVAIRISPAGAPARTVTVRTDATGRAQTSFKMAANTDVGAEFTDAGDPVKADAIRFTSAPVIKVGFRGGYAKVKVTPGEGRKVQFQQMRGNRWKTRKTVRANTRGIVKVKNLTHGIWRVNVPATSSQGTLYTAPWTVR